jgi:hypothetical protein
MSGEIEITLSDAAQRLSISWGRAWRLVLMGELRGTKRDGRWMVCESSVAGLLDDNGSPNVPQVSPPSSRSGSPR